MVRQENRTLSASVTVRPGWCWYTCPTASSSNSLPPITAPCRESAPPHPGPPPARPAAPPEHAGEELGGPIASRPVKDVHRSSLLHHHPAVHEEDAIGHLLGEGHL